MKIFYTLFITLFTISHSQAQVIGKVRDKRTLKALDRANVLLLTEDEKEAQKSTTDQYGNFSMAKPPPGIYKLSVSYIGYITQTITVTIGKEIRVTLDPVDLEETALHLSEVRVKANRPLFSIRKDTIEFSAKDIQTADHASIQNLLQKLPGISLDENGEILYQGKKIQLTINGRPLQSGPGQTGSNKITQILLASLVDKIQILDKKDPMALTGRPTGEKVLNIQVNKGALEGINGTLGAGYGNRNRQLAGGNLNRFRKGSHLVTSINYGNVTRLALPGSNDEMGAMRQDQPGLHRTGNIAAAIGTDIGKKGKLSVNANRIQDRVTNEVQTNKVNILPDSTTTYHSNTLSNANNSGNNLFASMELHPSERSILHLNIDAGYQNNSTHSGNTFYTSGTDTINKGNLANISDLTEGRIGFNADYFFRLNEKSSISFAPVIKQFQQTTDQQNFSATRLSAMEKTDTVFQQIKARVSNQGYQMTLTYNRQLSKVLSYNTGYTYNTTRISNNQQALNYDPVGRTFNEPDSALSYRFRNTNQIHTVTAGLFLNSKKIFSIFDISYNANDSYSRNFSSNQTFRQQVNYISSRFSFAYKFKDTRELKISFMRNAHIPDPSRNLIPVVSTSNPLYVRLGNPDLRTSINEDYNIDYSAFSSNGTSLFINGGLTLQRNGISSATFNDSLGKQVSMPVNVSGNYIIHEMANFGKRFQKIGLTLNYLLAGDITQVNSFIDHQKSLSTAYSGMTMAQVTWSCRKILEVSTLVSLQYTGNQYSLQHNDYTAFATYRAFLSINTYLPFNINFGTALNHLANTSINQQYTLLNAWISKTCLPGKKLLFKIYGFDLLKQNKSFFVFQTPNYIDTNLSSVLTQYFMCSVSYFFGKKPGP